MAGVGAPQGLSSLSASAGAVKCDVALLQWMDVDGEGISRPTLQSIAWGIKFCGLP